MSESLNFLDPSVLAGLDNLELRARIVVEGFLSGLHKSPNKGFSVEFNDYRHYQRGDDMRHIDWKLYARSDKFYIKQYEDETNVRCVILLDTSAVSYVKVLLIHLCHAAWLFLHGHAVPLGDLGHILIHLVVGLLVTIGIYYYQEE